jgi:phosphoserine phosphatase RsbU/P
MSVLTLSAAAGHGQSGVRVGRAAGYIRLVKVLVVDDEPAVRALVGEMVEMVEHEAVVAANGVEALSLFARESIRLVITDWAMPDMDGLELARRIRDAQRIRYTYVIMLTAFAGTEAYLTGMAAGADDFVTKPVTPDELHARIRVAERILRLQDNVKLLEGLINICMYCKRVHVAESDWTTVERYVEERSEASFSHDICPACYATRVQPDLDRLSDRAPDDNEATPGG